MSTIGAYKVGNRISKDEFVEKLISAFNIEKETIIFVVELLHDDIHNEYIYKSDISFEILEELKKLKKGDK